eukprot:m.74785 g.74785  ORF g.74785 m.74785 type:complete len:94 (-) comp13107_c0_seq2:489-770(-)
MLDAVEVHCGPGLQLPERGLLVANSSEKSIGGHSEERVELLQLSSTREMFGPATLALPLEKHLIDAMCLPAVYRVVLFIGALQLVEVVENECA